MTPDKCPKCGALGYRDRQDEEYYACGSHTAADLAVQSQRCIERQRDQLAADNAALRERVKELEELRTQVAARNLSNMLYVEGLQKRVKRLEDLVAEVERIEPGCICISQCPHEQLRVKCRQAREAKP